MSDAKNPVVADIKLHFIWHTKNKSPVLRGKIKARLKEILLQDCEAKGIAVLGGNIGLTHVHINISCPPRWAPYAIAKQFKGRSSRLLQQEFQELNLPELSGSLWSSGYFCRSHGDVTECALKDYIDNGAAGFHPNF